MQKDLENITSKEVRDLESSLFKARGRLIIGGGVGHGDRLKVQRDHSEISTVMSSLFQIRTELEMQMVCNLREFKEFIDNEMIVILGQMDSPTQIFEHVFLVSLRADLKGCCQTSSLPTHRGQLSNFIILK